MAVGLLPVSGCGDARVAPPLGPLPHMPQLCCVWRTLPDLPYLFACAQSADALAASVAVRSTGSCLCRFSLLCETLGVVFAWEKLPRYAVYLGGGYFLHSQGTHVHVLPLFSPEKHKHVCLTSTWSTWSAVISLTSRAGELRSAPSGPDGRDRVAGKRALAPGVRVRRERALK